MKFGYFAGAASALVLAAAAVPASAQTTDYHYTYLSYDLATTANFDFTVNTAINAVGGHDIVNLSGKINGISITSLLANPNQPNAVTTPDNAWIIDQVLSPGGNPAVDWSGVGADTADNHENNLYCGVSNADCHLDFSSLNGGGNSYGALTPSPAPEPASWALMLGGFGAIGGAMRSRRKTAVSFG